MLNMLINATERGFVPSPLIRIGIRKFCRDRLTSLQTDSPAQVSKYVEMLKSSPIAVSTADANQQHYELPASFFSLVLGPHRKYSSAYWSEDCKDLAQAEQDALSTTIERAELQEGQKILELGCGWGSLTLEMAKRFPKSQITAISNSASQREFILGEARKRGLQNVEVLTRDISQFEGFGEKNGSFDRVVSVEMFEHLRNYEKILARIQEWLKPSGKLFIHIFTHKKFSYLFETEGDDNWMGRYFFTGGQMPSHDLLGLFQKNLRLEKDWQWSGVHYQKTSEAWLQNMDAHRTEILKIFENVYGKQNALIWFNRWRIFFLAVAELFGFQQGQEWGVSHYLFQHA